MIFMSFATVNHPVCDGLSFDLLAFPIKAI